MSDKSTYDIHKERKKMWDASIANHARYIDTQTGLIRADFVKERSCPVCESTDSEIMFNKEGGTYVKCSSCAMVFLNPILKPEHLTEYYENNHAEQSAVVEEDLKFYNSIYASGIEMIRSSSKESRELLDFGCSSGVFLDLAQGSGFNTAGVELNRTEAERCKSKGHRVYNELFQNITFEEKYDVITLWDVFEHLPDGFTFLESFSKILAPDGLVFLQVPSSNALAARIMQEKCNMFDGIEHVNLYSPETIKQLAERAGYQVEKISTVIPEVRVLNSYLNYEDPYMNRSAQDDSKTSFGMSSEEILETLQGYKIQCLLRKNN